ncbi:SRPBCC domain-containing protein [Psychromarinibacter sp. C21-152]|uniref:SRPBCC domain-containing protein n=1 Tax=Psychromarinibacter sediminicola TaxID=3033385 RepID=A0AAE3NKZ5_9RHOB|nr:SRPBCC domain-containing protein [Psychromarinibacter sediminicola]MDF0599188.1 SRPBCC domain-containing protein [Psychromarinibacter sediminicola]
MTDATDAIVKEITVPLAPDRAFRLFTEEMADWWPLDTHSLSARDGTPARTVTVPAEEGAEVTETKPDGTTVPWGRVTGYVPGERFAMTWHVGRPEAQASHVEVTFTAVADGTRVTLVHSGWAALGTDAAALRDNDRTGWDGVFCTRYAMACAALTVPQL